MARGSAVSVQSVTLPVASDREQVPFNEFTKVPVASDVT